LEKQLGNYIRSVHSFCASKNILNSIGVWTEQNESEPGHDIPLWGTAFGGSAFAAALGEDGAMTMEQNSG
jgi:hypothetical protein